jgi:cathepsin F
MKVQILLIITLTSLIAANRDSIVFQEFMKFKNKYNKNYSSLDEFLARFNAFKSNYQTLHSFGTESTSHKTGINKFSDMTSHEFKSTFLTLKINSENLKNTSHQFLSFLEGTAPESFDWRDKNAVGPVKNQGHCGSCWAFSAVGNLEGLHAIKTGKIISLAEQQLVDCDKKSHGCRGGYMEYAFDSIKETGGLMSTQDYEYHAKQGTCHFEPTKSVLKVKDRIVKGDMNEEEMKEFLFTTGPLAIALNAEPLHFYEGGVLDQDAEECDPMGLNHGITLVGYGNENGKDYWIAKNSWGADWGEQGYFKIARGKKTCGINAYVTSAILE